MTRQETRSSEYRKSTDNLFGRLQFFYEHCADVINRHPPHVAISYITEVHDRIAPHVVRQEKARKALFDTFQTFSASLEEADHG